MSAWDVVAGVPPFLLYKAVLEAVVMEVWQTILLPLPVVGGGTCGAVASVAMSILVVMAPSRL